MYINQSPIIITTCHLCIITYNFTLFPHKIILCIFVHIHIYKTKCVNLNCLIIEKDTAV